jgi:hypothetical protein
MEQLKKELSEEMQEFTEEVPLMVRSLADFLCPKHPAAKAMPIWTQQPGASAAMCTGKVTAAAADNETYLSVLSPIERHASPFPLCAMSLSAGAILCATR